MNKLLGMVGTTVGGGLIGAGIQRSQMFGNKISSGLSKLVGKSGMKFDETTWVFLICGLVVLALGVYFTTKRN